MAEPKTVKRQLRKAKRAGLKQLRLKPMLAVIWIGVAGVLAFVFLPSIALRMLGIQPVVIADLTGGIKIYDRFDRPVCTIYGDKDQQPVPLKQISPNLQHAVIAVEDHQFYNNDGVNPEAIVRAMFTDLAAGHAVEGASTISQQLVKNLYFEGQPRTIPTKIKEALMAMDMTRRYPKNRILEAYLNCVYFGNGVYGAQRASEYYFGKPASKLDVAESAFLAGLVKAPSELSQPQNRAKAIARQQLILNSMGQLHLATTKQIAEAKREPLAFHSVTNPSRKYLYYTSEVLQEVRRDVTDDNVLKQGINVYTYLDPAAQSLAEKALASGIRHAPKGIDQGALVSVSVKDGGIIAMVGGAGSYARNQWNRATSPHTAGSAFKPFVYLAALSNGTLQPDSLVDDSPLEVRQAGAPTYKPHDYDGQFLGEITIRKALALSRNIPAVRVAQQVGPDTVVDFARRAGITSKLDPNLSLALGSSAVSPLDMANAYATLARNGEYVEPAMVRRITDSHGNVIKEYSQNRQRVFQQEPVAELVDAMQDVVERGTGSRARLFDRPVAGKTGTADGSKDIWFIGFTPDLSTAVWGGNDANKPVPGHAATGGSVMAGIWQNYMRSYYQTHDVPAGEFVPPDHPLMDESEPLHIIPTPADIFNRLFGPFLEDQHPPVIREYRWGTPERINRGQSDMPPEAPPIRKKRPGLIKRFLNWLDF